MDKGYRFGHPNRKKIIYPSTSSHWESPKAHPIWEKILFFHLFPRGMGKCIPISQINYYPFTYLQWERMFFKSVCKILLHLFPQRDRKLSGVLKKYFCPTSVPTRNLTVALPRSRRQKQRSSQGRIRSALFNCQGAFERTLSLIRTENDRSFTLFWKSPFTNSHWERQFSNPNWKIPLTNSHRDTPIHKGVWKSSFTYSHWARQFTNPLYF